MYPVGDAASVLAALALYRSQVLPPARRELARWQSRAATIPDPALREVALSALREKARNVEATAVFAIVAPRANRAAALQAIAALQITIDYLDTLSEQPLDYALANALSLHESVIDAVSPGAEPADWYSLHGQRDDGGYLAALVAACREEVAALPAKEAVLPLLQRAARRCGEGQSHTHAAARAGGEARGGAGELEAWARQQEAPPGYLWWEVAAGASSSVAAHALIAGAADPLTTAEEAALIDAAYFPSIGALTVLLDDLIDREEDDVAGEHSYLGYCAGEKEAANRIALLASRARPAIAKLRRSRRHGAILAGVAGFYLSDPGAQSGYADPIRARLIESLGPTVQLIMAAMRLRRDG